ncbi:ubx domain-containing protein [Phlyctema vagabunda]|uniref:UBX domain-containing protein 2 n=1 Tax=Phlyctema vagabunda TaxID=108571 RepID=A0ABR4PA48_9HELO
MANMFYRGDLQTGIGKALQEGKLVACFVTDEGDESQLWENDFLRDESIKPLLSAQTVLLRLVAGSTEAGYLAAIFPLPKTPTFVIIQNQQLREYLISGISKEDFCKRVKVVLEQSGEAFQAQASSIAEQSTMPQTSTERDPTHPQESTEAPTGTQSPEVQNLLTERAARLAAHKKEQDAKEKAERAANAKAIREANEATVPEGSKKSADMKYALMQKKRQQEAREERARILKRVEDDKAERREKEALRKAQAKAKDGILEEVKPNATASSSINSSATHCALQVRLFDGSTIRSRFPAHGTLRADVRPWIDEQQGFDVPYTFKQVLTPLPNKNISISEEEKSLRSQGLSPNSTLILVPVQGYTSAYDTPNGGIVSRGISTGFGLVSSGVGMVTGAIGSLLGGATAPGPRNQEDVATSSANTQSATVNVRTLRDDRRTEDHQLYNGNALNFEPRRDDDDKKED